MLKPSVRSRRASWIVAIVASWAAGHDALAWQVDPASPIAEALTRAEAGVNAIVAVPDDQRSYENTVLALDDVLARLDTECGMTLFMQYVSTDKAERERGSLAEQHYNNWIIDLGKNEAVYKAIKSVEPKIRLAKMPPLAYRLVEHTLRDYRRAGMELPADQREKLTGIQKEISRLGIEFDKNIRDDEITVLVTREELEGMPDDFIAGLKQAGTLYIVGMDYPTFNGILENCRDEITRQRVWTAYKRRGGQKNVAVLEQILKLRAEAAKMLKYPTAADYEIEVRMAKNAANVKAFYEKLRPLVREKAQRDFDEYLTAKRQFTGDKAATLWPWDQPFYEKLLQREKYAVDSRIVQEYFPMNRVVDGLFSITQSLYGLEYRDITESARSAGRPFWHADVRLFEVWDKAKNELLGEFYVDLYPRENKYTHAAQWGLVPRKRSADGTAQKPLAALVCNFTKPTADKPSLLTHEEVETFFHEFGHCLHTILTEVEVARFAGTSVERDFVEAPSQMFENWVWDADVLKTFALHYQTNQPLPDEVLQGMIRARHLGSGLFAEHQFYYGLVDLTYHVQPDGVVDSTKVGLDLFEEIELFKAVPNTYFQASFGHLVGYQAGYYGYQWSLVYASDMFQRFKELGMLNPEAGKYYRSKILARGGTIDGLELVKDYLGREPKMDAYLEHLGLKRESTR
jgi:thimet oligopeptidase